MRRTMLAAAATAFLTVGAFLPSRAQAMTIAAPVSMQAAIGDRLAEDVAYVCRPVWRLGLRLAPGLLVGRPPID